MSLRELLDNLNIVTQCKKYGVPLRQCPQFLFVLMGFIIVSSNIAAYFIGSIYIDDPLIISLIILALTTFLIVIAFAITKSFERLAEVSRLKSEFIRIVSHQLRSPLTNVNWATDILLSGALGRVVKEQLEYFKILKDNNARMRDLVKDLLLVAKLEEGALPIRKEHVSLENIVKGLISKFSPFAKASNAMIRFVAEPNLPEVFIDVHQIEIVIETLMDNAIRYMKKKGNINISLRKRGRDVLFSIKDNGVGIPREDQKYIFKKFFRSRKSKKGVPGSGLGLFTAKTITERMGGKIWFDSEENVGTTFYLILPIK